jgi:hypothetical protein
VTEREDPLSFVLRNRPAREVLEELQAKSLMIPLDLRKSVGLHPETFRRLVSDLDEFALVTIRALPRARKGHRRARGVLRIPIGVEITETGRNLLEVTRGVRATVQRHARLLPAASADHWLLA